MDSRFSCLLSSCNSIIDGNGDSAKVKSNVIDCIGALPYQLDSALNEVMEDVIGKLHAYLLKRLSEFKGVDIVVPNHDFHLRISTDVDIESVVDNLDVTFEDVLDVAGSAAGFAAAGAGIGSIIPGVGTIVGAAVGAGVGLIAGVGKKAAFGDGGKAKAKQAVKDEINVCKSETKAHLKGLKLELCRELEKMESRLIKQVQTEINNIESLQEERFKLYNLLRK